MLLLLVVANASFPPSAREPTAAVVPATVADADDDDADVPGCLGILTVLCEYNSLL